MPFGKKKQQKQNEYEKRQDSMPGRDSDGHFRQQPAQHDDGLPREGDPNKQQWGNVEGANCGSPKGKHKNGQSEYHQGEHDKSKASSMKDSKVDECFDLKKLSKKLEGELKGAHLEDTISRLLAYLKLSPEQEIEAIICLMVAIVLGAIKKNNKVYTIVFEQLLKIQKEMTKPSTKAAFHFCCTLFEAWQVTAETLGNADFADPGNLSGVDMGKLSGPLVRILKRHKKKQGSPSELKFDESVQTESKIDHVLEAILRAITMIVLLLSVLCLETKHYVLLVSIVAAFKESSRIYKVPTTLERFVTRIDDMCTSCKHIAMAASDESEKITEYEKKVLECLNQNKFANIQPELQNRLKLHWKKCVNVNNSKPYFVFMYDQLHAAMNQTSEKECFLVVTGIHIFIEVLHDLDGLEALIMHRGRATAEYTVKIEKLLETIPISQDTSSEGVEQVQGQQTGESVKSNEEAIAYPYPAVPSEGTEAYYADTTSCLNGTSAIENPETQEPYTSKDTYDSQQYDASTVQGEQASEDAFDSWPLEDTKTQEAYTSKDTFGSQQYDASTVQEEQASKDAFDSWPLEDTPQSKKGDEKCTPDYSETDVTHSMENASEVGNSAIENLGTPADYTSKDTLSYDYQYEASTVQNEQASEDAFNSWPLEDTPKSKKGDYSKTGVAHSMARVREVDFPDQYSEDECQEVQQANRPDPSNLEGHEWSHLREKHGGNRKTFASASHSRAFAGREERTTGCSPKFDFGKFFKKKNKTKNDHAAAAEDYGFDGEWTKKTDPNFRKDVKK